MLSATRLLGPRQRELLDLAATTLSELDRVQRQLASENARQHSEAVLLSAMPFALMAVLNRAVAHDLAQSRALAPGLLLLVLAYSLAVGGASLVLRLLSGAGTPPLPEAAFPRLRRLFLRSQRLITLGRRLTRLLPSPYRLRIYRAMRALEHSESDACAAPIRDATDGGERLVAAWVLLRLLLIAAALCVLLLCATLGQPLPWALVAFIGLIVLVLPERQLFTRQERYQLALLADLPLYMTLVVQLLRSGFSLSRALLFCLPHMEPERPLAREWARLRPALEAGSRASSALTAFASRLDEVEAHRFFLLLAQHERFGSADGLDALNRELAQGWLLMQRARRRSGDLQAAALLLPMLMSMLSVILIGLIPVLSYFLLP